MKEKTTVQVDKATINNGLWAIANDMRGKLSADDFKDYILPMMFYKFLSDRYEKDVEALMEKNPDLGETLEEVLANEKETIDFYIGDTLGYVINIGCLNSSLVKDAKAQEFTAEKLQKAFKDVEESTKGKLSEPVFEGLFDTVDVFSAKLGKNLGEKNRFLSTLLLSIDRIFEGTDITANGADILGDAYEFLIAKFAAGAGQKAGEFYTPYEVSDLIALLMNEDIKTCGRRQLGHIYDPTVGSGSLLLQLAKRSNEGSLENVGNFYGQELNTTTYNLARMNLLLHLIPFERMDIKNGDTLTDPQHIDKDGNPTQLFDTIVANPPYSLRWDNEVAKTDKRFEGYGGIAPKGKADFAFVQHMLYHLEEQGKMAVVLPHGVLFRGNQEGRIRKHIIEKMNCLDTLISLPPNLFFGTTIPTCIMIFEKDRKHKEDVYIIDASLDFGVRDTQNYLRDEDKNKILEAYKGREDLERYARKVSREEIKENDYNLNIPRYVDTSEPEEPIDLDEVTAELLKIDKEIAEVDTELEGYFRELGLIK